MKKLIILCIVLYSMLPGADNSEKRLVYWQMRESSIRQEINGLNGSEIYPYVGDILSNCLTHSENLIKAISAGSDTDINAEEFVDAYSRKSFDAAVLRKIGTGPSSVLLNDKIKTFLISDINSLSDALSGYHSDFYSAKLIDKIADERLKKQLLEEYFLLCIIDNYESLYIQFKNSAFIDIKHTADETNSGRFSASIIRAEIDRKVREFDIEARLEVSKNTFNSAILSKEISYLASKRLGLVKEASLFLKLINDADSLERGDYYLDKTAELEKAYFSALSEKNYSPETKNNSSVKSEGGITFSADSDYIKFVSEIDRLRKENTALEKLKKSAEDLPERFFSSETPIIKKKAAEEYLKQSLNFTAWKEKAESVSVKNAERYLMREEPLKKYISFIHEREKSAASLDSQSEGAKIYSADKQRIRKAEDSFRMYFSVDKTDREYMSSPDYGKISASAAEFALFLKKMQMIPVSENTVQKSEKKDCPYALAEIEALSSMINQEIKRYRELSYSADMINEYSAVFAKYEDSAKSGVSSDELKDFYERKTLLPYVKNYDQKKIDSENRARDYIAKMIVDDNVRIKQVSDYYARMGLCSRKNYDAELKSLFNQTHVKKIGVFPITVKSIAQTDKKVSAYIVKIIERKRWERGDAEVNSDVEYDLPEFGISVMVPSGWERRDGDGESISFFNNYDGSEFLICCIEEEGKTASAIFDTWSQKHRLRLVKSSGGNYSGKEFISRVYESSNRKAVLAYCGEYKGKKIIVSGEVKKEKYQFFAPRIDSLFKSVKEK